MAGTPASLTSLWTQGQEDVITKGALMSFQTQNGLTVDGLPGAQVWTALLADAASSKLDADPYVYVVVSKTVPQTLTLYNNGAVQFTNIPVNTGAPGADTADGTYPVFEHVPSSRMQGTNPDGSTYDDPNVPWASYFNGGDALHGFPRASYGTPQSNGCVEMAISDAAQVWPLTPVGTLVTVVGTDDLKVGSEGRWGVPLADQTRKVNSGEPGGTRSICSGLAAMRLSSASTSPGPGQFDAHQRWSGLPIVLLDVVEEGNVVIGAEDAVEELAQGTRLLRERDQEVVLESLEEQGSLHDVGVTADVVVAARDDAHHRPSSRG